MIRTYKYCLLPTEEQKRIFINWFGACRFIYNLGLEAKKSAWESLRVNVSYYDLAKQLTELKQKECSWLDDCPRQSLESSLSNLDKAYMHFFNGGGYPKYKNKANRQSITFRQKNKVEAGKIRLTKIGWIDFIEHRPLGVGEIRTVTVSKTPTGAYFVSILIRDENELPVKRPILDETTVGIDVGLKTFATLSDGQTFDNPKYLHEQLRRLKKEQRTLARRYKKGVATKDQSKGWHKQKLVVTKLHEKIVNKRKDFLHKTSTAIIKQFDTVCLEDLNVAGMMKNRALSKSISDVSWYQFGVFLKYKAEWYGKNVKVIGRFDPSSKICSTCGTINKELKLSDREWPCQKCGITHDRDENAAKNIKSFGSKARPSIANVKQ